MSMRLNPTAGVVTFAAAAAPDLPANPPAATDWVVLGGDWGTAANWSTGIVPGIGDDVTISDNGTATNGWTVTETAQAAASLTLAMTLGTLEATTALTVAGTLTQTLGTLLADPGTTISVAALTQTAGTVILNDDGTGTTTLDSGGTDSVNGEVTLVNGAAWTDAALGIGIGTVGGTASVSAAVTLDSGTGDAATDFATLSVTGAVQIGADPGSLDAGGVGSLDVANGSIAYVGALSVLNGSVVSVDKLSGIVVGAAAATLAAEGAIVVAATAAISADVATLDASVVSAGTFAVMPWQGAGTTEPGSVVLGGGLTSSGSVSVAALASLSAAGSIELDAGSLTVGAGGSLAAGGASSAGLYLAGGALVLNDGATLSSLGTADTANSNATLLAGAVWTTSTLTIAAGYPDGPAATATVSLAGGATLSASGELDIGNDPAVFSAVMTADPGGVGSLLLGGASTVEANAIGVLNGSLLSLDATSTVILGSATAEAGTVAVGADGALEADIGTIAANVDDAGTLAVVAGVSEVASDLRIAGSLTGVGTVSVTGTLQVSNATAFAGSVTIAGGGDLVLDAGGMAAATIAATGGTASIDVKGQSFATVGMLTIYNPVSGLLVFGDAASQSTLDFGPNLALGDFSVAADAGGTGTLVTEVACFAAGTRIATDRGEVPIEALRPGDRARLAEGGTAPVVWLGHRRVDCRRHPRPADARPVRVAAHAFGLDRPHRDLLLSPDHAVFVEGVLIPVRYLLNDATVRQQDVSFVTYWHVELPAHRVLLADGLPCESFLDTGNRAAFANGGAVAMARPDFARAVWQRGGCAPLVTEGAVRDLVYRRLLAQAFALGWHLRDAGAGATEWLPPVAATGSAARRAAS
jgi:hypothetical protein